MRARLLSLLAVVAALPAWAADQNLITMVEVKDAGAEVVLSVHCSKKPSFTTFSMADPPRFVIDFSESKFQGVPQEIAGSGGVVQTIKNLSYGTDASAIARVMVAFSAEVNPPAVEEAAEGLVVRIAKPGGAAVAAAESVAAPKADAKAQADAQAQLKVEADAKAQADAAAMAKAAKDAKAQADAVAAAKVTADAAEAKAQADAAAQAKAKLDADAKTQADAAAKAKADQDAKAQADAAALAKAKADQDAKTQADEAARAKAKADQDAKAQAQADAAARAKAEADADARAQAEAAAYLAKVRADAKAQADEAARAKARADADAKAQADAEARAKVASAARAPAPQDAEQSELDAEIAKAKAEAAPAAPGRTPPARVTARAEKLAPAGPVAQIREVGFRQLPDASRIYVRTSATPQFSVQAVDDRTVRIEVENARAIRRNDLRFLDTSFFASAVELITPSRQGTSYVLTVKLRQRVPYEQKVEGDMLAIDFQRPPASGRAQLTKPASGESQEESAPAAEKAE